MFSLFLLGDIFAVRMRYNLVSLGCDIPRYARCDMIQIPSRPAGHIVCVANIAPVREYRKFRKGLISLRVLLKDNTLLRYRFFISYI